MQTALTERRHLIERQLRSVLPSEAAECAVILYDKEFATSEVFSLADFCRRLSRVLPEFPLPREARLSLLRELQQVDKAPTSSPSSGSETAS